jgi:hypothetical protein
MSGIVDNITGVFGSVYGKTKEAVSGVVDTAGDIGQGAFNTLGNAVGTVENAGQGVLNVAQQGVQTVGNAASSTANTLSEGANKLTGTGGKRGKMSKKMMKMMRKMNKTLQNKVKSAASYNLAASIGGRRYRGGYSNYSVTSTFPSGVYDMASPYPAEAYGTPMPLPSSDPMPTLAQQMRGGNVNQVQLPAGGLQVNVQDAAGNSVRSMGIALPSPVNVKVTSGGRRHRMRGGAAAPMPINLPSGTSLSASVALNNQPPLSIRANLSAPLVGTATIGGRRHRSRRHSRKGGKSRKSQKGCSKKMSYGGKRGRKSRRHA